MKSDVLREHLLRDAEVLSKMMANGTLTDGVDMHNLCSLLYQFIRDTTYLAGVADAEAATQKQIDAAIQQHIMEG